MKLYIDHYTTVHKWKKIAFVVREWVLRDNHLLIINDLKFLIRKWISVILFHNIAPNLWNNTFLRENIEEKIPSAIIGRVPSNIDIYEYILSIVEKVDKLIFLERQYLIWENWEKINTISTRMLTTEIEEQKRWSLWIWNVNLKGPLLQICQAVEKWIFDRVHILPWGRKNAIKHELFSLEWVWTLIWNDFWKPEIRQILLDDVDILKWILDSREWNQYLKKRTKQYLEENISNFRIAYIDWIPVGCVEIIQENECVIELWALKVVCSFLSLKLWKALIDYVISYAITNWFEIISLTNNRILQGIYERIWFKEEKEWLFQDRANKSPWIKLFHINIDTLTENYK